jgi:hypothetical protein
LRSSRHDGDLVAHNGIRRRLPAYTVEHEAGTAGRDVHYFRRLQRRGLAGLNSMMGPISSALVFTDELQWRSLPLVHRRLKPLRYQFATVTRA